MVDDLGGDALGGERGAEVTLDFGDGEGDGGAGGGLLLDGGGDEVDEFAFEVASGVEDELGDEVVGGGGGVEVGSALEAVGGIGVEEVAAAGSGGWWRGRTRRLRRGCFWLPG